MSTKQENRSNTTAHMQDWLVALCAVGTFLLIWWLLKYSFYGIDFTDESFYLVWMANPFLYNFSVSQFGFVYHPLYILLGGDIADLRQSNIIITFALAWGLTYFSLTSLAPGLNKSRISLLAVSSGFATSAFILFDSGLVTPSYNSLNLQALLIAAIGLILAEKTVHRVSIVGWVLVGIGGWLTFMAKPSTALALAVGVFVYLPLARKFSIRMLGLAVACALSLLLVSALVIDHSVLGFIKRIQFGVELARLLESRHTLSQILRVDGFQLDDSKLILFISILSVATIIALWCMCAKNKKWSFISPLISITFFMAIALLTTGQIHQTAGFGKFQGLLIFGLVFALVITTLAHGRLSALKNITLQQWATAALFLVMPHIYAFGSNINYWEVGSSAAIFWLLAALTLLAPIIREQASWSHMLPVVFATQAVTATLLQTGLEQPYRQPQPLRLNSSTVEIGPQKTSLILSEANVAYLASAMSAAENAGFLSNTPVIDLSGQSPGILYALGARNIGHPWTLGGYPGSLAFLKAGLSRFSCEDTSHAWVLYEHDGPRNISAEIVQEIGAYFPEDYQRVATWYSAPGAGGYPTPRFQELYKPVAHQKVLNACQKLR